MDLGSFRVRFEGGDGGLDIFFRGRAMLGAFSRVRLEIRECLGKEDNVPVGGDAGGVTCLDFELDGSGAGHRDGHPAAVFHEPGALLIAIFEGRAGFVLFGDRLEDVVVHVFGLADRIEEREEAEPVVHDHPDEDRGDDHEELSAVLLACDFFDLTKEEAENGFDEVLGTSGHERNGARAEPCDEHDQGEHDPRCEQGIGDVQRADGPEFLGGDDDFRLRPLRDEEAYRQESDDGDCTTSDVDSFQISPALDLCNSPCG
ncbi:MAG: hypothetical protein IPN07_14900 [Dehalococcoidia bacterium]|nr:hypothetical protein [Dehalococcoidia bacterium]